MSLAYCLNSEMREADDEILGWEKSFVLPLPAVSARARRWALPGTSHPSLNVSSSHLYLLTTTLKQFLIVYGFDLGIRPGPVLDTRR